jgi:diguanylate cyclase (GGDEF)-like protein
MQNNDSGRRQLPPQLVSVVMPALPQDMVTKKKSGAQRLAREGTIAFVVLAICFIAFVGPGNIPPAGLLLYAAMVGLAIAIGLVQQKDTKKRVDYEKKLYDMTLQLSEKNVSLKEQVQIDPLTELLNRRGLEKALTIEVARGKRKGVKLYAALIDCDDFKQVNENFGHAVGDLVLQNISRAIDKSVRPTDYASRIGGDEFMLLLVDLDLEDAARVCERVRMAIKDSPVIHESKMVPCTASIGVCELPLEVCTIEEMLTLTRAALKESKLLGKNKMSFTGLKRLGGDEDDLDSLAKKFATGAAITCVWQPIIRLKDRKATGYEILARGPKNSPFEMPRSFFRLAQEKNMLTAVDIRCLKLALACAARGKPELRYHINIFPSTMLDIPVEALHELFVEVPKHARICIELSETQFLGNYDCLLGHVTYLKERGVDVALDDVGFTRSSLESLIILEPTALKLHENLTKGVHKDQAKEKHLERLVRVARSLDTELIAESVEDENDINALMEIGIEMGQGYYWGMPAAPEEATASAAGQA